MDFEKIKKMEFNPISELNKPQKSVIPNKPEELEPSIDGKSPNNPQYWQNSVGVRQRNISFCGNNIEPVDDAYIDKMLKKLSYGFLDKNKEKAESVFRRELETLKPYGRQVVDNYAAIILSSHSSFVDESKISDYSTLSAEFAKTASGFDECRSRFSAFAIERAVNNSLSIDDIKKLIGAIMPQTQLSAEARKLFFSDSIEKMLSYNDEEQADFVHSIDDYISSFVQIIENIEPKSNDDIKTLLRFNPDEMKKINSLFSNKKLPQIDLFYFMQMELLHLGMNTSKDNIVNLLNKLEEDEKNQDLFAELIAFETFESRIDSGQIVELMDGDVEFLKNFISRLKEKRTPEEGSMFTSYQDFADFLRIVNNDNIEDFFSLYDGKSSKNSIAAARQSVNPKTNLFDRKITDRMVELEERGVSPEYSLETARSCIDASTGEFSPIAENLLDFFSPYQKEEGLKGKLKYFKSALNNKYVTRSRIEFHMDSNPSCIMNSVKNNNGEFDEDNLAYLYKIIKMIRKNCTFCSIPFSNVTEILDSLKNKNGVVDSNKFKRFENMYMHNSLEEITRVLDILESFPENKQDEIYNTCMGFVHDRGIAVADFEGFAAYCFDNEGNEIPENVDFVRQLPLENENFIFKKDFFDICSKCPELKSFILDILENIDYQDSLDTMVAFLGSQIEMNGSVSDFVKEKMLEYAASGRDLNSFGYIYEKCQNEEKNCSERDFNNGLFNRIIEFRNIARIVNADDCYKSGEDYISITDGTLKPSEINFRNKVALLNDLRKINTYTMKNKISGFEYLESVAASLESSLKLEDIALPIDSDTKINFLRNILYSRNEYTNFENIMISAVPMLEQMTNGEGLPLSYSRNDFLHDLTLICETDEDIKLLQKTGITPILDKNDNGDTIISGYNGLIKLNGLDINNPKEKQIYDCMNKFMYGNEVITGNKEFDEQMNIIIKACPEFINTIGKKQHGTHNYTLDVHSLLVMAYSINNPEYLTRLNSLDRALLKISAIFHDIMKQENTLDKGHQNLSSLYTRSIIHKIFTSSEIQDRVFGLIDNHHWLEEYSNSADKERTAQELAFRFRKPNDFEIAKIMADSDLKAVNADFYEHLIKNLADDKIAPVKKNIDYLYSNGNAIFSDYIVAPSRLDNFVVSKDGKEYRVINMHEIPDSADMGEYGFMKGIKKEDIKFLVHMVDEDNIYESLSTVKLLTSPFNGGVLSESLITPKYKRTYQNRKYGVLLSQENVNIINEAHTNQGSGIQKDFSDIISLVFNNSSSLHRNNFKTELLENLGFSPDDITDEEYAEFYKDVLADKTSLMQIRLNETYKLGDKSITGEQLREALKQYQDNLIDKNEKKHNEIVGYLPEIQAVTAKEKSLDKVPEELLRFAYENNYPIILI